MSFSNLAFDQSSFSVDAFLFGTPSETPSTFIYTASIIENENTYTTSHVSNEISFVYGQIEQAYAESKIDDSINYQGSPIKTYIGLRYTASVIINDISHTDSNIDDSLTATESKL